MGRPKTGTKNINDPQVMWDLFIEYKTKVKDNPRLKHVHVGKDAFSTNEKLEVPLTMEGYENYVADKNILADLGDYFRNKDGRYSDFTTICSRIKGVIRQDQIEGGMVGVYNPSITQRLNGLAEKVEQRVEGGIFNKINIDVE